MKLHLGFCVGTWVSIPCLLKDTSHIHWFCPPKQSIKKQKILKKRSNSQQIILYYLSLYTQYPALREVDLEYSPKRGSDKINMLRQKKKHSRKQILLYSPELTNKKPVIREVDFDPMFQVLRYLLSEAYRLISKQSSSTKIVSYAIRKSKYILNKETASSNCWWYYGIVGY